MCIEGKRGYGRNLSGIFGNFGRSPNCEKSSHIFYLKFPPVRVFGVVEPRAHVLFFPHFSAILECDLDVFMMSIEEGKF